MTDTQPRSPGPDVPADSPELGAPASSVSEQAAAASRRFAVEAARLMADYRCEDVLLLDLRGLSEVTHFIVLATGSSDRQLKSVARYLGELAGEHGMERIGTDRDEASKWVVLDYIDVMIHLFEPATRAHYDLEMLWGDARRVDWQREA